MRIVKLKNYVFNLDNFASAQVFPAKEGGVSSLQVNMCGVVYSITDPEEVKLFQDFWEQHKAKK